MGEIIILCDAGYCGAACLRGEDNVDHLYPTSVEVSLDSQLCGVVTGGLKGFPYFLVGPESQFLYARIHGLDVRSRWNT